MARIRVDTDDLKAKAKDFETAANAFNKAGDEIAAAAMGMPSYDGQLSGPARAAGYEIQRQSREVQALLAGDAQSLQKTAQAFEEANNQAIDAFGQNQELLASHTPDKLQGIDIGNAYLGYRDDGLSETVILCMYGVCNVIPRKGNELVIADFEKKVDDYVKDEKTMWDEWNKTVEAAVIASGLLIGLTIITGGTAAFVAAGLGAAGSIGGEILESKACKDAQTDMAKDTYGAAYYWNIMFGSKGLGPCTTGDDIQDPVDLWKRQNQDIYDPTAPCT